MGRTWFARALQQPCHVHTTISAGQLVVCLKNDVLETFQVMEESGRVLGMKSVSEQRVSGQLCTGLSLQPSVIGDELRPGVIGVVITTTSTRLVVLRWSRTVQRWQKMASVGLAYFVSEMTKLEVEASTMGEESHLVALNHTGHSIVVYSVKWSREGMPEGQIRAVLPPFKVSAAAFGSIVLLEPLPWQPGYPVLAACQTTTVSALAVDSTEPSIKVSNTIVAWALDVETQGVRPVLDPVVSAMLESSGVNWGMMKLLPGPYPGTLSVIGSGPTVPMTVLCLKEPGQEIAALKTDAFLPQGRKSVLPRAIITSLVCPGSLLAWVVRDDSDNPIVWASIDMAPDQSWSLVLKSDLRSDDVLELPESQDEDGLEAMDEEPFGISVTRVLPPAFSGGGLIRPGTLLLHGEGSGSVIVSLDHRDGRITSITPVTSLSGRLPVLAADVGKMDGDERPDVMLSVGGLGMDPSLWISRLGVPVMVEAAIGVGAAVTGLWKALVGDKAVLMMGFAGASRALGLVKDDESGEESWVDVGDDLGLRSSSITIAGGSICGRLVQVTKEGIWVGGVNSWSPGGHGRISVALVDESRSRVVACVTGGSRVDKVPAVAGWERAEGMSDTTVVVVLHLSPDGVVALGASGQVPSQVATIASASADTDGLLVGCYDKNLWLLSIESASQQSFVANNHVSLVEVPHSIAPCGMIGEELQVLVGLRAGKLWIGTVLPLGGDRLGYKGELRELGSGPVSLVSSGVPGLWLVFAEQAWVLKVEQLGLSPLHFGERAVTGVMLSGSRAVLVTEDAKMAFVDLGLAGFSGAQDGSRPPMVHSRVGLPKGFLPRRVLWLPGPRVVLVNGLDGPESRLFLFECSRELPGRIVHGPEDLTFVLGVSQPLNLVRFGPHRFVMSAIVDDVPSVSVVECAYLPEPEARWSMKELARARLDRQAKVGSAPSLAVSMDCDLIAVATGTTIRLMRYHHDITTDEGTLEVMNTLVVPGAITGVSIGRGGVVAVSMLRYGLQFVDLVDSEEVVTMEDRIPRDGLGVTFVNEGETAIAWEARIGSVWEGEVGEGEWIGAIGGTEETPILSNADRWTPRGFLEKSSMYFALHDRPVAVLSGALGDRKSVIVVTLLGAVWEFLSIEDPFQAIVLSSLVKQLDDDGVLVGDLSHESRVGYRSGDQVASGVLEMDRLWGWNRKDKTSKADVVTQAEIVVRSDSTHPCSSVGGAVRYVDHFLWLLANGKAL